MKTSNLCGCCFDHPRVNPLPHPRDCARTQKLAFIDVAKGIRMFARLRVPCVAVVENMSYFRAPDTGAMYKPFGEGSGKRIQVINRAMIAR